MIKDKWKVFSMRSCFSTEMTEEECVQHFDALGLCDMNFELEDYMATTGLVQWHPFEYMPATEFAEYLEANAAFAQATEEKP